MKGYEFLENLSNIDHKLIDRARMPKQKTSYMKWITLAASFLIIISIGLFGILKPKDDTDLPILSLPEDFGGGMGFEGYLAYSIDELTNANPWNEDLDIKELPVIKNSLVSNYAGQVENPNINKMKALLTETANNLGIDTKNIPIKDDSLTKEEKKELAEKLLVIGIDKIPPEYLTVGRVYIEDTEYKLEVDSNMTAKFELKNPISLPDKYNFTYDSSYEELEKVAEYLKEEYSKYINMKNPQLNIYFGDYNVYGDQSYTISFFEGSSDPIENILNYNFTRVIFYGDEDGKLWLSRNFRADLSQVIGNYPIISAGEAEELLVNKNYITTVPEDFPGREYIRRVELIYRDESWAELYMPYYKFYVELPIFKRENGLNTYGAFYVPAVQGKYIKNMPLWDGSFN